MVEEPDEVVRPAAADPQRGIVNHHSRARHRETAVLNTVNDACLPLLYTGQLSEPVHRSVASLDQPPKVLVLRSLEHIHTPLGPKAKVDSHAMKARVATSSHSHCPVTFDFTPDSTS